MSFFPVTAKKKEIPDHWPMCGKQFHSQDCTDHNESASQVKKKTKPISTTLESLYWVCLASFPVFFWRLLYCVSQRVFCSFHHSSERIGRKYIHFSVWQRQKVVFSLLWRLRRLKQLFELSASYLNRRGPRQYVTNIYRWNSSSAWGEKRPL